MSTIPQRFYKTFTRRQIEDARLKSQQMRIDAYKLARKSLIKPYEIIYSPEPQTHAVAQIPLRSNGTLVPILETAQRPFPIYRHFMSAR